MSGFFCGGRFCAWAVLTWHAGSRVVREFIWFSCSAFPAFDWSWPPFEFSLWQSPVRWPRLNFVVCMARCILESSALECERVLSTGTWEDVETQR